MNIDPDELRQLLHLLDLTQPEEIDCDEFLGQVSRYVETLASSRGVLLDGFDDLVHHLALCPECLEEFHALRDAFGEDP